MTETAAGRLASFGAELLREGLPEDVRLGTRQRVFDTVGLLYGAAPLDTSRAASAWAAGQGGAPRATAAGLVERLPAGRAAFVNGVLAHSLDYDDTHLPSIVHPSASVVPAGLAMAEAAGRSGEELLRSIAAGIEVCCRLGMAGYDPARAQSLYFEHGQHATSICGTVGGALTCALLLDGGERVALEAMAIAASFASGVIEANRAGGTVKRMHCGWAAQAAVTAAELATEGVTGPPTVFEGRFGLLEAFLHTSAHAGALTDDLGDRWEAARVFVKPYPANHFTHGPIDAALALRERGLDPDSITSIEIGVAGPTVRTIGEPIEAKRRPATGYEAQFSGPYAVAAALLGGGGLGLGQDDFSDTLAAHPARRALMDRVDVHAHPEADAGYPHQFPCVLTVRLADGSTVVERVLHNRGGPERPLADEELAVKFRDNAARSLDVAAVAALEHAARAVDTLASVDDLWPEEERRPQSPRGS